VPATVFGLPLHVLMVHAVVVLIPLSTVGIVVIVVSERWRERLLWPVAAVATVATASAVVATQSGESLQATLGVSGYDLFVKHRGLGDAARIGIALMWLSLAAYVVLVRRPAFTPWIGRVSSRWVRVAGALAVAFAILATVQVVLAGDSGARAVWTPLLPTTAPPSTPTPSR